MSAKSPGALRLKAQGGDIYFKAIPGHARAKNIGHQPGHGSTTARLTAGHLPPTTVAIDLSGCAG